MNLLIQLCLNCDAGGGEAGGGGSFTYCDEGGVPLRRHPISIKGTGGGKKMLKEQNKTKKNKTTTIKKKCGAAQEGLG